ncbi:MAG: metal ABC transporter substrate-binding protein [Nitrospinaceae bacterium]|nr:metal ABC transporter substrate-binding protein [Nitrospinaceae bacterium]
MKKKSLTIYLAFLFLFLTVTSVQAKKISIVTTTTDIASITREIGGDFVSVDSIAKGGQDPHYIQAKPSYMVKLNRADLLIYQGLQLEMEWLSLLIEGARNPKVWPLQPGHLDLSRVIEPLEIPIGDLDRSMGHVHPQGNPHYNLSPSNAIKMANAIADTLSLLDQENEIVYRKNLDQFVLNINDRLSNWKSRLNKISNKKVIVFHRTWIYLFTEFGIDQIGTIEKLPGVPPTPMHLAKIKNLIEKNNVRAIIQAVHYDSKFPDLLSSKTGVKTVVLPAFVGGVPEATNYLSTMEYIVTKLENAFSNS